MKNFLFEKRALVGKKINQFLQEKNITKSELCEKTTISRPTLNKIINGEISNKSTYNTHIEKILNYINITPIEILNDKALTISKNISNYINKVLTAKDIAEKTGLKESDINKWITGQDVPNNYELSKLATVLGTSSRCLMKDSIFGHQTALPDFIFAIDKNKKNISGFWGHIGIQIPHEETYKLYPVSEAAYSKCFEDMQNKKNVVFPTLNNRVVFVNQDNINRIVLIGDNCDIEDADAIITNKENVYPQEFYDNALQVIWEEDVDLPNEIVGDIKNIIEENEWEEEDIIDLVNKTFIHFKNGRVIDLSPFSYQDIGITFESNYDIDDDSPIYISDNNGAESFIQIKNIAIIDAPLNQIEEAINEIYDKSMNI
ncbi:MAG: helix-turn-helix transcriptional regulator [Spirochaetales bacterium]|nr:helix-turn-helix transcriptional regulator [Spirochaetales bacterium]